MLVQMPTLTYGTNLSGDGVELMRRILQSLINWLAEAKDSIPTE